MDACSPIVSVPVELISPFTSPSITSWSRNLTEPMIETPLDRRLPDWVNADAPLDCSVGLAGPAGSDFRVENIAICIFRVLQLWLRVQLILFLHSNNRRPIAFKICFDPRNPRSKITHAAFSRRRTSAEAFAD